MARWTASAKWAAGPALDGRSATLLGLGLNEGLGFTGVEEKVRVITLLVSLEEAVPRVELDRR